MSTQDDGFGRKAGPNPGSQSDFTNRPSMGGAPGMQNLGQQCTQCSAERGKLNGSRSGKTGSAGHRTAPDVWRGQPGLCTDAVLYARHARLRSAPANPRAAAACLRPLPPSHATKPARRLGPELSKPASAVSFELPKLVSRRSAELSQPSTRRRAELPEFPPRDRARLHARRRATRRRSLGAKPISRFARRAFRRASRVAALSGFEL